jgi:hypothetical protein
MPIVVATVFISITIAKKRSDDLFFIMLLAGVAVRGSNPLLEDFVLVARKLERLGFVYGRGSVFILGLDVSYA